MSFSMRCPKCGLIQRQSPTCKSCGTVVPAPGAIPSAPSVAIGRPTPSPAKQSEPTPEPLKPAQPTGVVPGEVRRLFFHGTGGSLFEIQAVNILLTLVTLGIYSFWARVRVRKYLLSQTEFEGDRFAYHGTGKEVLIGFLKAMLVFGLPIGVLTVVRDVLDVGDASKITAAILIYCILMVFIPFAMVSTRRYRLSRISWRGIRFSFRGRVTDFIKLFIGGSLLTVITLTLYYPIFVTKRYAFMVSHSYFGNQKFHFDGQGRDLFWSYLLALLLLPLTLGLYWFWFLAKKQRYFMEHTSFATARFHSTVTGWYLLVLNLVNFLLFSVPPLLGAFAVVIILFLIAPNQGLWAVAAAAATGGKEFWIIAGAAVSGMILGLILVWVWVMVRNYRFALRYLSLEGALNLAAIQQEAQAASATGEGLSSFLDMDFDLG